MLNHVSIRVAVPSDIEQICHIDTDASSRFSTVPALADLADGCHGPLTTHTVKGWMAAGSVYVIEEAGQMLGFTAVQPKDGVLYVAELSVVASRQGQGLGGMLLEKVFDVATQKARDVGGAVARVSLTTYPDVPWNGPWYRKRGFQEVNPGSIGSWHRQKARQDDRDLARPGYRRCCMLREESMAVGLGT